MSIKHFLSCLLPVVLLTSCFGKTDETPPQTSLSGSVNPIVITSAEQEKAATEYKRVQKLTDLTAENLGTMVRKTDNTVALFDRRLFINYLKTQNITSTEKLISSFQRIEDFSKKENIELTKADILVTLVGFDQETPDYDMCKDFLQKKSLNTESKVFKELTEFCVSK
jgi:hypothetical protein